MPVSIHGKEYYTVVERMGMLIKEHKEKYSINTDLVKLEGGVIVIKATLTIGSNSYTGNAMEEIGSNQINKFSALENCETSAIGRALSAAGYFGTEFCSANEMDKVVQKKQNTKPEAKEMPEVEDKPSGEAKIVNLVTFGKHNGTDWKDVPEGYLEWICTKGSVDWQVDLGIKEAKVRGLDFGPVKKKENFDFGVPK